MTVDRFEHRCVWENNYSSNRKSVRLLWYKNSHFSKFSFLKGSFFSVTGRQYNHINLFWDMKFATKWQRFIASFFFYQLQVENNVCRVILDSLLCRESKGLTGQFILTWFKMPMIAANQQPIPCNRTYLILKSKCSENQSQNFEYKNPKTIFTQNDRKPVFWLTKINKISYKVTPLTAVLQKTNMETSDRLHLMSTSCLVLGVFFKPYHQWILMFKTKP